MFIWIKIILLINFLFSQYSYELTDINPNSSTYQNIIGPNYFSGTINIHYFGHQT